LNWPLWAGFALSLLAVPSYFLFFARFPETRDIPWANFVLFAVSGALLFTGVRRAYRESSQHRGKILASILSVLSLGILVFFGVFVFYLTRQLPASLLAPRVGAKAPGFELPDTQGRPVNLAGLLGTPISPSMGVPKAILLVFYRGYW
jgi:hypothetical protein